MTVIGTILYLFEALGAMAIGWLYDAFKLLAGITPVTFGGEKMSITQALLGKGTLGGTMIGNVYMRFALIGFILAMAFAIAATIKRFFDHNLESKLSYGKILINLFKSMLMIILMNVLIFTALECSSTLLKSIMTSFTEARTTPDVEASVNFDDSDYQTMGRIMDTIGDYSLNPSYNSRYNLNSCFNDIREDLGKLKKRGKFKYPYVVTNADYHWQYSLQQIAESMDLDKDQPLNVYNEHMSEALLQTMDLLRYDSGYKPISHYSYAISGDRKAANLDMGRTIMVIGTFGAARLGRGVETESLFDEIREPYLFGDKDIYNPFRVGYDFSMALFRWSHLQVILLIIFLFPTFLGIAINVAARLFNMVFLYLVFPFIAATQPYDDGAKLKQWTTAFVIQMFSFFGTVIAVQLFYIFLPIIYDDSLVFSSNVAYNWFIKGLIIIAFAITSRRASDMLSGILAENASMQALHAGNVGAEGVGAIKGALATVGGGIKSIGTFAYDRAKAGSGNGSGGSGGGNGGGGSSDGGSDGGGGNGGLGGGPGGGSPKNLNTLGSTSATTAAGAVNPALVGADLGMKAVKKGAELVKSEADKNAKPTAVPQGGGQQGGQQGGEPSNLSKQGSDDVGSGGDYDQAWLDSNEPPEARDKRGARYVKGKYPSNEGKSSNTNPSAKNILAGAKTTGTNKKKTK